MFQYRAIPVPLKKAPYRILMTIRSDCDPDSTAVVFAKPSALQPIMDTINSLEHPGYLAGKRGHSWAHFQEAARNSQCAIPGPDDNPVPLAIVYCHDLLPKDEPVAFGDGITRTSLLLELEADFVPLQVALEEAPRLATLIGNGKMPVPASQYVVDAETQLATIRQYYQNRSGPILD